MKNNDIDSRYSDQAGASNDRTEQIRVVGIVAKTHAPQASQLLPEILEIIDTNGMEVMVSDETSRLLGSSIQGRSKADLMNLCDLVIVLGGDGTLLSLAKLQGKKKVKILGINMGYLGFLTEVPISEAIQDLQAALKGKMYESRRMMLRTELERGGRSKNLDHVLNDVVINKSALARIFDVDVMLNGERITTIRADGIIVSTPTGSTAYNLAAGGPIIHPEMDVIVVTPICPHTLTNRPVVLPGDMVVEMQIGRGDEIYLTLDGQHGFPIADGDIVRVRRGECYMHLLSPSERSYFDILKNKLNWGKR